MRSLLLVSIIFHAVQAYGQGAISEMAAIKASYSIVPNKKIDGTSTEIGIDQWEIQAPFFYKKLDSWMLASGIRYQNTDLEFSDPKLLNEDKLHSIDLAFFISKKQSENLDFIFLFNPSIAGDFEDIDSDSMNYMTIFAAKWKTSETFEWILGAVYTTGISDDLFVPAIGFTWKPSNSSSLLFAGPIIRYKHEISDSLEINFGGQFTGNRWNTQSNSYTGSKQERNFRLRSYRVYSTLQWNLDKNNGIFASGGIDFARKSEIKLLNDTELLDSDVKSAPSFEIGYSYSF